MRFFALCSQDFKKGASGRFEAAVKAAIASHVSEPLIAQAQALWVRFVAEKKLSGLYTMCSVSDVPCGCRL